jgi:hypothetical protein
MPKMTRKKIVSKNNSPAQVNTFMTDFAREAAHLHAADEIVSHPDHQQYMRIEICYTKFLEESDKKMPNILNLIELYKEIDALYRRQATLMLDSDDRVAHLGVSESMSRIWLYTGEKLLRLPRRPDLLLAMLATRSPE